MAGPAARPAIASMRVWLGSFVPSDGGTDTSGEPVITFGANADPGSVEDDGIGSQFPSPAAVGAFDQFPVAHAVLLSVPRDGLCAGGSGANRQG